MPPQDNDYLYSMHRKTILSFTSGCSNLIRNINFNQASPLKEPEQKIARNSQKKGLCYPIACFD